MITKMKLKFEICLVSISLFGLTSFAIGGMEGGGGKSIVCRGPKGDIKSSEILDLYEGRAQYGLTYSESNLPWQQQISQLVQRAKLDKYPTDPPSTIISWYKSILQNFRITPIDVQLKPIDDSFEVIAPKNCVVEQAANYLNDQQILISGEIWNALSETQKAALFMHEATYRYLRAQGETNSRRARHFVAYLFAGGVVESPEPVFDNFAYCTGRRESLTEFFISNPYNDSNGVQKVRIQFGHIMGRKLLSKSFIELDNLPSGPSAPSFLSVLKNPNGKSSYNFHYLSTTSNFEDHETVSLEVGLRGKLNQWIEIVSPINNQVDSMEFNCRFN